MKKQFKFIVFAFSFFLKLFFAIKIFFKKKPVRIRGHYYEVVNFSGVLCISKNPGQYKIIAIAERIKMKKCRQNLITKFIFLLI